MHSIYIGTAATPPAAGATKAVHTGCEEGVGEN